MLPGDLVTTSLVTRGQGRMTAQPGRFHVRDNPFVGQLRSGHVAIVIALTSDKYDYTDEVLLLSGLCLGWAYQEDLVKV